MTDPSALRVVSLESRQANEMARLLDRHGCVVIPAPSMREVALSDQSEVFAFGERLFGAGYDVIVLLTGVGIRMLVDALCTRWPQEDVLHALGRCQLVCRGPKPVAVLKSLGLRATHVAPEPNTWHDLLAIVDAELDLKDKRVVVQEYGRPHLELAQALEARGAQVQTVSVYGWAMPQDVEPVRAAITQMCQGAADAVLFTSARQSDHLFEIAAADGSDVALRDALKQRVLVVSIGPITSKALETHGIGVDLVPPHPKMGHMVLALAKAGTHLLAEKRAARSA